MSDLERLIRAIVRDEISRAARIANANQSRARSPAGISGRDQGDPECEESERMDHTSTETNGESSSSEPTASELLRRLRAKPLRNSALLKSTRKRAGER